MQHMGDESGKSGTSVAESEFTSCQSALTRFSGRIAAAKPAFVFCLSLEAIAIWTTSEYKHN